MPDEQGIRTAVERAVRLDGVAFPRGTLGPEGGRLAGALEAPDDASELHAALDALVAARWPELRPPIAAAIERALGRADEEERGTLGVALELARDEGTDNPLARAIAVRAATELSSARRRAREIVAAVAADLDEGGAGALLLGARAAGAASLELLDLDPEDFGAEIADYVDAADGGEDTAALAELARRTGDTETRAAAREAMAALDGLPERMTSIIAAVLGDELPDDAAADAVWIGAVLTLVEQAVERAIVEEATGSSGGTAD